MNFIYCPYCKEDLIKNNYEYSCINNHKVYINPAPCVSVIPVRDNKILLSKRGKEPFKGSIDVLGGFVNVGETIEEASIREVLEETGLKVKIKKYLGEYTEMDYNPGVTYPIAFLYTADVISGEVKANDDVSELFWVDIDKIPELDLSSSFPTIKPALEKVLDLFRGGQN